MLETHNENRKEKVYNVGQVLYEKEHETWHRSNRTNFSTINITNNVNY